MAADALSEIEKHERLLRVWIAQKAYADARSDDVESAPIRQDDGQSAGPDIGHVFIDRYWPAEQVRRLAARQPFDLEIMIIGASPAERPALQRIGRASKAAIAILAVRRPQLAHQGFPEV